MGRRHLCNPSNNHLGAEYLDFILPTVLYKEVSRQVCIDKEFKIDRLKWKQGQSIFGMSSHVIKKQQHFSSQLINVFLHLFT